MNRRIIVALSAIALTTVTAGCTNPPQPSTNGDAPPVSHSTAGSSATPGEVDILPPAAASPADPPRPAGNTNGVPQAGQISPTSVDPADASAVAVAAVTTINRQDTATDASPLDALRRAARWLSPTLLRDSLDVPERGDADWTTLASHHGYTLVDQVHLANETGQPPNTPTLALVQVSDVVVEIGRDGWREPTPTPKLARVQLTRAPGRPWLITAFIGADTG